MRGKVPKDGPARVSLRITPAYAGKRDIAVWIHRDIEDHPRVCGEKKGKITEEMGGDRITPAYAGKSTSESPSTLTTGGSPPRMRGKGACAMLKGIDVRITPAYAGKRDSHETNRP